MRGRPRSAPFVLLCFLALCISQSSRISQGIRESKKNGVKIGLPQGTTLTTKKALECMAIIKKHSKDFGGSLDAPDVIKLCGCSRNSYYKYKRALKSADFL